MSCYPSRTLHPGLLAAVLLVLATTSPVLRAAVTDISNEPILSRSSSLAKPNLMFILDDSGSMDWSFMPDEMGDANRSPRQGTYGYWSSQCNGLAFNPSGDYSPPLRADGTLYPNMSITAARTDGYVDGSPTVNLTNSFYYRYTGTEPALSWKFNASGLVDTTTTFYRECLSNLNALPGASKFTRVALSDVTPEERQKHANWFSYYSRRILLMRTAVGKAVQALDSGYRLGFSRINNTSVTDGANFRDVKPFDTTQKANFYSSLYGAAPGGGTPLRGALSKVGRYFAKKVPGQTYDPIEHSCQRNYAILSTDGYWNSGGFPGVSESTSYGPLNLAGTNVGNQDAGELRPMYDGGSSVTTSTTPSTTVKVFKTEVVTETRRTSRRDQVVVVSCGLLGSGRRTTTTKQTRTESFKTLAVAYRQTAETNTRTVVVTNGSVTSDTTAPSPPVNTVPISPVAPAPLISDTTDTGFVNDNNSNTGGCVFSLASPGTSFTTPVTTTNSIELSRGETIESETGPTAGATTSTTVASGGTSNTLSDVAQYYYSADLRTASLGNCASRDASGNATDVCLNNVATGDRDQNSAQHLTTFAIGLGVSGTLTYDKGYLTQTSGDYVNLKNGSKSWPATTTAIDGVSGDARNIDDLWHAAVNGRGQYYSALSATALAEAIAGVVSTIKSFVGAGAGASFDTLALVSGDTNRLYQAGYRTGIWSGDLKAYAVDGSTGAVVGTALWSAQDRLKSTLWSDRQIHYRQSPLSPTLKKFTFSNLDADGYGSLFSNLCSKTLVASQCASLAPSSPPSGPNNLALANDGTNLVNYLRGDTTYEASNTVSPLFRSRSSPEGNAILGDIVSGAPVYVGKPPFSYTDAGYSSYAASKSSRKPMVYAAANDGMLHAFEAATGKELWAYVPTPVMPNLYKLANKAYGSNHQYFVDGEPVVGDIYADGAWKTILVGGLGGGGRAYYALDVTDPDDPKSLWEFTDNNLGLAYGNPIITKRADGTWIVAFASGYNNTTGDGRGHLYVLNANTGAKLLDIPTTAGSPSNPSGLAKINTWVDKATNNTSTRFYGGDLLGNLWRFDIDNLVEPKQAAHLMAQLQTSSGTPQPVTVRPEPVLIAGVFAGVAVATGRFLGASDITDTTQQSVYLLKDSLTSTGLGVVRDKPEIVVRRTVSVNGTTATSSTEGVNWDTQSGWWFDLPQSGERVITGMALQGNTLTVASAIPRSDPCVAGGASWLYDINIVNGLRAKDVFGVQWRADNLIVGITNTSGESNFQFLRLDSGGIGLRPGPPPLAAGQGDLRRTSWRELVD